MSSHILTGESVKLAQPFNWSQQPAPAPSGVASGSSAAENREDSIAAARQIQLAFDQGRREGDAAAQQASAERIDTAVKSLATTIERLSATRAGFRQEAEEDVVKLGIAIARRVLNREIQVDGEAMLGIVKAALQRIDARELHRVRLHPEHSGAVTVALAAMSLPRRIEVIADGTLEPGAAIFETSRGSLDASIETQLREIERGFVDVVHTRR